MRSAASVSGWAIARLDSSRWSARFSGARILASMASLVLVIGMSVGCTGTNGDPREPASSRSDNEKNADSPVAINKELPPAASTRVVIGDSVQLPSGTIGTVGLWLMNPGTCEPDVTYEHVASQSRAVVMNLCLTRQKQWYAKLAFPGQKLSQGTDNMWLPVDDLMLIPK